jgi:hypothetical protein
MSYTVDELLSLSIHFEELASGSLIKIAKKKPLFWMKNRDYHAADVDSKAKVRNRGKVVFPAESPNVTDKKDHFPINDEAQARNALARANQFSSAPEWYKGSLSSLVSAVARAVKKHYPKVEVSKAAKKPDKN